MTPKHQHPNPLFAAAEKLNLGAKQETLSQLADSDAGKAVKAQMEQHSALNDALAQGDMVKVGSILKGILSSPEGSQLTRQLQNLHLK